MCEYYGKKTNTCNKTVCASMGTKCVMCYVSLVPGTDLICEKCAPVVCSVCQDFIKPEITEVAINDAGQPICLSCTQTYPEDFWNNTQKTYGYSKRDVDNKLCPTCKENTVIAGEFLCARCMTTSDKEWKEDVRETTVNILKNMNM